MSLIVTDIRQPVKHPGRRMSDDEMKGRNLINIKDPEARYPDNCSRCGARSCFWNPLKFIPVTTDPKKLAQAYLYKAICATGCRGLDA